MRLQIIGVSLRIAQLIAPLCLIVENRQKWNISGCIDLNNDYIDIK